MNSLRVTLDTNACDVVHDDQKKADKVRPETARALRAAIENGKIQAFVSEASIFVECLSFADKLTYLSVAGTEQTRPTPDSRRVEVFQDLASIGVKLLHAPLIGAETFIEGLQWADDTVHSQSDRLKRYQAFIEPYARHKPLKPIGYAELTTQGPLPEQRTRRTENGFHVEMAQDWAIGLKRAYDNGDRSKQNSLRSSVGPIIGEWCDTLILGSHKGYGNDIFCSIDEGKGAGSSSLMHLSNRASLAAMGVVVMSPEELMTEAARLGIL